MSAVRRAAAVLLVVLALAACRGPGGPAPATPDEPGPPGASSPVVSPSATPAGEDGPSATPVPGLAELQGALDDAERQAGEVENDLAADGSS